MDTTNICMVCRHRPADTTPYLCRKCAPHHREFDHTRWPETFMSDEHVSDEWVVVSNGPSAHGLSSADLPDGFPRVAVNHVISHPGIEFDYWCVWETQSELIAKLHLIDAAPTKTTWIPTIHEYHWKTSVNHLRDKQGSKRLTYEVLPARYPALLKMGIPPWGGEIDFWWKRSCFMALAGAIRKGAKMIYLYGAEMEGTVNFSGGATSDELRIDHAKRHNLRFERWEDERRMFHEIQEECREHGVRIERVEVAG